MTSIEDNIVDRRILIDWDGDGFINEGVLPSTPINLFPDNLYATSSFLKGFNTAFTSSNYTDTPDTSRRGLIRRSIRLGDQATSIRFMMDEYKLFQPFLGDTPNIMPGNPAAANFYGGSTYPPVKLKQMGVQSAVGVNAAGSALIPTPMPDQEYITLIPTPTFIDGTVLGYKAGKIPFTNYSGSYVALAALGYQENTGSTLDLIYSAAGNFAPGATTMTKALDNPPIWGGIPATVGTFTLSLWVLCKSPTSSGIVYVYSNNSVGNPNASPYWGRDFLSSASFSGLASGKWQQLNIVFTVSNALATNLAIDMQFTGTSASVAAYVAGVMLRAGNLAAPTRFYDNSYKFSEEQFSFTAPDDSQDYTVSYYVRSTNGITQLAPTRHVVPINSNTTTDTALTAITVTSDWQRVNDVISGSAVKRGVFYTYTAQKSGVPVDASHAGDVEFSGFQVTEGSVTTWPYHAGTGYGLEDISEYVLSVHTQSGKGNFNDVLPKEGTAEFPLNNDSLRFSPDNEDSPLYGLMNQNLKTIVQIWDRDNEVWADAWNGWTSEFQIEPGRTSSRQATIMANQGLYRLADGQLGTPIITETTMDVLAKTVIESSGWRGALNVLQSFVGLKTEVGTNAYTMDTDLLYDEVQEGVNRIEISGRDWTQATDPRKALEDVLGAENATLWLNRNGSMTIVNRDNWIDDTIADTLNLDTDVQQADYRYGEDIINAVEITVTKNKTLTDQPVWATKRPVKLIPNQRWVVDLNPTYTEGKTRTVIRYTLTGMTKAVYTQDTGISNDTSHTASQVQADAVIVELLGEAGSRPQLRLTNQNSIDMWVNISVKGDYLESGDSLIVKVEDANSIEILQGKHTATYSNPLLTDDRLAASHGEFLMLRQSLPKGEFTSFSVTIRNTDDLNRVLALSVGDLVLLKETQSDEEGLYHAIIGEDIEITNSRTLTITYHAARTMQESFAKADVSNLYDPTVNELCDMYSAYALGGGSSVEVKSGDAYGIDKILVWQTGGYSWNSRMFYGSGLGLGGTLILKPKPGQVTRLHPVNQLQTFPLTDAAGNAFAVQGAIQSLRERSWQPGYGMITLPPGDDEVLWYTKLPTDLTMVATGTAEAFIYARRSKTTDASVGAAAYFDTLLPVTPGAFYRPLLTAIINPAIFLGSGQTLVPIGRNGTVMKTWAGGAGNATPSVFYDYGLGQMTAFVNNDFKATNSAGVDVPSVAFKTYSYPNKFLAEGLYSIELLRFTQNKWMFVDTAITTYYTVFVKLATNSVAASEIILTLWDDVTGVEISHTATTVTGTSVAKIQATTTGHGSFWVSLDNNHPLTNIEFQILSHGATDFDPATYTDLLTDAAHDLVYA